MSAPQTTSAPEAGQNPNPVGAWYRDVAERTPVVTRYIIVTIISTYLLSWLTSQIYFGLANCPAYTVYKFEVYRVLFSPFIGVSLLSVLFVSIMTFSSVARLERAKGSVYTVLLVIGLAVADGVFYVLYSLLAHYAFGDRTAMLTCSKGFWVVLMGLIVMECEQAPDLPRRLFLFPVNIASRYFPWVMLLFFALFGGNIMELLIGVLVGYAYARRFLAFMEPGLQRVASLEEGGMRWLTSRPGFVSHTAAGVDAMMASANQQAVARERQDQQGGSSGSGSGSFGSGVAHVFRQGRLVRSGGSSGGGTSGSQAPEQRQTFPGAGRTIASSGSRGGAATSAAGSGAGSSQHRRDRELLAAAAAARLARKQPRPGEAPLPPEEQSLVGTGEEDEDLEQGRRAGGGGGVLEDGLARLQEMGYSAEDARRALQLSGGDVEAAAAMLMA